MVGLETKRQNLISRCNIVIILKFYVVSYMIVENQVVRSNKVENGNVTIELTLDSMLKSTKPSFDRKNDLDLVLYLINLI